jgi:fibronectin-binding autotransporter adhesin
VVRQTVSHRVTGGRRRHAGIRPAAYHHWLASSAPLALVLVMASAPNALAQSVTSTGEIVTSSPPPGTQSWTVSDQLNVGEFNDGTLTIDGGGTVTSTSTIDGFSAIIGTKAGAHGTVTVQGAGSTWTNSSGLVVGYTGAGTLNINSGGKVTAGDTTLGIDDTGDGHLTVDGHGSSFESTGQISLGGWGQAHLQISDGGHVSSVSGIVGNTSPGVGDAHVVVTGIGSTWANSQVLTIGGFSIGEMTIQAGGSVTSNQGYIGAGDDGVGDRGIGTVTVTGPGSSWIVDPFSLTIANDGTGSLTIDDGGLVRVEGGIVVGNDAGGVGTLTVQGTTGDPGVLETGGITGGLGTATVTLDGGLVRATDDNSAFFASFGTQDITLGLNGGVIDTDVHTIGIDPRLVGPGGLTKAGAGTLILTGANTYAGPTDVNAGRLEVNGDQTAAHGLATVAAGATLAGSGIVGGSVTVTGGTVAPGASDGPGTLTINGSLSLDTASSLNYRLGQAGTPGGTLNDLLLVHGDLALNGTLNVTASAGGTFGPGVYRLIDFDGALTGGGLILGSLPAGGSNVIQTSIANQVNLVNTASPGGGTPGGGVPGGGNPPPPPPPPPPAALHNFWDGDTGVADDGTITGGDGVWHGGTGSVWTQDSGATNGRFVDGIYAIFAAAAGTVTVDNSSGAVSVSGMQFASDGYKVSGGAIGLDAGDAIIRVGDGTSAGAAFKATIGSELTGAGQLDKTDLGTLILTGTNSFTGGTKVSSGTLQLGDGGTSGSIQGDVAVDGTLAFNRSDTAAIGGAISGAGLIQQIGSGATVLTADSSAFAGRTEVQNGTLEVDGALGGSADVFAAGRLAGVGQVASTTNRGLIAPGRGGIGTLTIAGDYLGAGGGLEIEVVLGGDASPADRLAISGATSGVTPVRVVNLGGAGAQTIQGIPVVQVGGVSAGRFVLPMATTSSPGNRRWSPAPLATPCSRSSGPAVRAATGACARPSSIRSSRTAAAAIPEPAAL